MSLCGSIQEFEATAPGKSPHSEGTRIAVELWDMSGDFVKYEHLIGIDHEAYLYAPGINNHGQLSKPNVTAVCSWLRPNHSSLNRQRSRTNGIITAQHRWQYTLSSQPVICRRFRELVLRSVPAGTIP